MATKKNTFTCAPPISTRRSPKSICNCWPGRVSKRTVARASARSSCRNGATARSTVRKLTVMPFSAASSWRTTSAFPACCRKRSATQSSRPSSAFARTTGDGARQPPVASHRFTVFREQPSSVAMRFEPHPRAFSASIADTSSGVRISILRETRSREEPCDTASVM